jgi:palmitoyltransferase
MAATSSQAVLWNRTIVEEFMKGRSWQLAVHVPAERLHNPPPLPLVKYPLPFLQPNSTDAETRAVSSSSPTSQTDGTMSSSEASSERDSKATRTFAILQLEPDQNPWDLGFMGNWKSVMGNRVIDWFLPIKRSPCCNHEDGEAYYEIGRWLEEKQALYGFIPHGEIHKPRPVSGRKVAKVLDESKMQAREMTGVNNRPNTDELVSRDV